MAAAFPEAQDSPAPPAAPVLVKRHRLSTRIWHWINALTLLVMLMSGLMIFNAHPRLYWGHYGANSDYAWLEIGSTPTAGYLRVGSLRIATTGLLGHRVEADGRLNRRAFPGWMTIPSTYSLSAGRRWHLAFAWILAIGLIAYLATILTNRHAARLTPRLGELKPGHLWHDIKQHARLRFPTGQAALDYNVLQKIAYSGVIFVLLPLVILTGLGMSPGMNAGFGWMVDLLGGRQSARSIHFLCAWALVFFFLVHIVMVVLAGPVNELRSMITGWYRVPPERTES